MERFNPERFSQLTWMLTVISETADQLLGNAAVAPENRSDIRNELHEAAEFLDPSLMPLSLKQCQRAIAMVGDGAVDVTGRDLANALNELRSRVHDELSERLFFTIPPERASYFNSPAPFGEAVAKRFPECVTDIEEASNCFALARYNACVYHTARVLEAGVQALAVDLRVPLPHDKGWDRVARGCRTKVKDLPSKADRERYHDALNHLDGAREAWRNPTMHPRAIVYSEHQALDIFNAARAFMQRLSRFV